MKDQIEEIMDQFDFERTHKVMKFLGWSYAGRGVPSIDEIKKNARERLEAVLEENVSASSSGGFVARKTHGEHEDWLSLDFMVASLNASR